MWVIAVLAVLLLGAIVFSVFQVTSLKHQVNVAQAENEQLQLTNEQLSLSNEFEAINSEFRQYENQAVQMANDTILAKYTAAKNKVEQLIKELNSEKTKNAKRIKDLESQIATLRGLLRNYIAQVDSLTKENAGLRAENQEIKSRNKALNSQVAEISGKNKTLTERMTLAEKLNVTGLTLTPLKKNGKQEKNVTKAKQLKVTFTIPQNNSTPVGAKTIYLRIVNPEGQLLGNAGSFSFEGGNVPCSAKKTIEYTGDEMSGVTIYWDVNTTLTPGDYLVELFADNFRIASRHFTLKK
jgi:regulator of replication initiation timing